MGRLAASKVLTLQNTAVESSQSICNLKIRKLDYKFSRFDRLQLANSIFPQEFYRLAHPQFFIHVFFPAKTSVIPYVNSTFLLEAEKTAKKIDIFWIKKFSSQKPFFSKSIFFPIDIFWIKKFLFRKQFFFKINIFWITKFSFQKTIFFQKQFIFKINIFWIKKFSFSENNFFSKPVFFESNLFYKNECKLFL